MRRMPKKKTLHRKRRAKKKITKKDVQQLRKKIEDMEMLISGLKTRIDEAKVVLEDAKKQCKKMSEENG